MLSLREGTLEEDHILWCLGFLSSAWVSLNMSSFVLSQRKCQLGAVALRRSVNELEMKTMVVDGQGEGMGPSLDGLQLQSWMEEGASAKMISEETQDSVIPCKALQGLCFHSEGNGEPLDSLETRSYIM